MVSELGCWRRCAADKLSSAVIASTAAAGTKASQDERPINRRRRRKPGVATWGELLDHIVDPAQEQQRVTRIAIDMGVEMGLDDEVVDHRNRLVRISRVRTVEHTCGRVEHLALPPPENGEVFVQHGGHLGRNRRHGFVAEPGKAVESGKAVRDDRALGSRRPPLAPLDAADRNPQHEHVPVQATSPQARMDVSPTEIEGSAKAEVEDLRRGHGP
jgi:hypothetical protein